MALFQNYNQRIGAVEAFLNMYGISSPGEAGKICAGRRDRRLFNRARRAAYLL